MNPTIKYTIENINGIQTVSDSFDVNDDICLIRIKNLIDNKETKLNCPSLLITDFKINDVPIVWKSFFSPFGFCNSILDIPIDLFIKDIRDIIIKIKEKSKIEVQIFTGKPKKNIFDGFAMPTINCNKE